MSKRKKIIIAVSVTLLVILGLSLFVYFRNKKIKADVVADATSIVGYYGSVTWSDGTPAKGTLVDVANRQSLVKDDGSYAMYLGSDDFDKGIVRTGQYATISFLNSLTGDEYSESGQMEPPTLPKPTDPGKTYSAMNFVLQKPPVNSFAKSANPVIDSAKRTATFGFNSLNPTLVTISLKKNGDRNPSATITKTFSTGGAQTVVWDEKDTNGKLVPNGTYTATVSASDGVNPVISLAPISFTLANVIPANNFKLVGTPTVSNKTATFKFTFANPTTVTINIVGSNGRAVRTVTQTFTSGTSGTVTWDGKDSSNRPVANGTYRATITGDDKMNTATTLPVVSINLK